MTNIDQQHKNGCPQKYDAVDDCMCDYIKPKPKKRRAFRVTSTSNVRKAALDFAASTGKFSRVSRKFVDVIERQTVDFIRKRVENHPRRGMTLM